MRVVSLKLYMQVSRKEARRLRKEHGFLSEVLITFSRFKERVGTQRALVTGIIALSDTALELLKQIAARDAV